MLCSRRNDGSGGLRLQECGLEAHQAGWAVVRLGKFDSSYVASEGMLPCLSKSMMKVT